MNTADLTRLVTECRLAKSLEIDLASTEQVLQIVNEQDQRVALAVAREIPQIARAVDLITGRIKAGGHLFYVGAGTSGRLGVLDASELPSTFGTPRDLVQGLIAGGRQAVFRTQEAAEDDGALGRQDIASRVSPQDTVVGIAASGWTPYTVAALAEARRLGCATVALTNNADADLAAVADVAIAPVVGPEVIMGSTRMKAGTAQKMVLNMISTAVMIKLGKVYTNLMIDMQCSNEKLRHRAVRTVMMATGADEAGARTALAACHFHMKTAIVSLQAGVEPEKAAAALQLADGFVRRAIELALAAKPY